MSKSTAINIDKEFSKLSFLPKSAESRLLLGVGWIAQQAKLV